MRARYSCARGPFALGPCTLAQSALGSVFAIVSLIASASVMADDTIVVTATRTSEPLSEIGQALSVIDSDTIVTRQSDTVVDLLRTVPGVTIARNGGIGASTAVFIRGAESDQTVALIDGVKLNDPASPGGGFNFANLLAGNIERIEVLRGSQSVLWGSQAIGGIVNVITKEPTDELTANARADYGWRDTRHIVGNVSRRVGPLRASLGAGSFRTDGISSFSEARGGTEHDGYRNFGAQAKLDVEVSDSMSLDLRGWYSNGRVGIDGFAPPTFAFGDTRERARTREAIGYSALNLALFDGRLRNRLASAYTQTQRDNNDPDAETPDTFDASGRNLRFEYQGTLEVTQSVRAVFGAETERSRFTTASFGGPATRGEARIDSGYGQVVARPLAGLTAIAGVRHDQHDEFGGKTTAAASAAWTPNQGATSLRASYSEGFKAPTLFQLQSEYGNGVLRPESARSWDAGMTQRLAGGAVEIGVTGFRRETRDLINFVSCASPLTGVCANRPSGTYDNVARARAQGVELTVMSSPIEALQMQGSYSHVDSENRSPGSDSFGNDLARRPNETASAVLDYAWGGGFETGLTYTYVGSSFDNASNTRRIGSYDIVDLRAAWALTTGVKLQARVENLLDERYETIYRYGTPGRAAYASVLWSY